MSYFDDRSDSDCYPSPKIEHVSVSCVCSFNSPDCYRHNEVYINHVVKIGASIEGDLYLSKDESEALDFSWINGQIVFYDNNDEDIAMIDLEGCDSNHSVFKWLQDHNFNIKDIAIEKYYFE